MKPESGTYTLIMLCHTTADIQIGRWGRLNIHPAYYIYVGSAFGPGGVQARVKRHYSNTKLKHWHIDYLTELLTPVSVWYSYEPVKLEHQWAQVFTKMDDILSIKGFGCSDCSCYTHLFTTATMPDFAKFSSAADGTIESRSYKSGQ